MVKKLLRSSITTLVASILAIGFIVYGGIHAVQAAPRIESADYRAQVVLSNIHVVVTENGNIVEGDDTLLARWPADQDFAIGKTYDEVLAVQNDKHPSANKDGEGIDEYVRVTVYRYWTNVVDGKEIGKDTGLKPEYIDLHFVTDNGWTIDKAASTPERTVLYYNKVLQVGESTPPFADKLTISSEVGTAVSAQGEFSYEDVQFHIKVTADAVQTHNGEDAMMSAWGRTI